MNTSVIEIGDEKLRVRVKGQDFELNKPTMKQMSAYREKFKDEGAATFDIFTDFLVEAGLPRETVENISSASALTLIEHLSGSKKN